MKRYVIGLDEGTTSARSVVYDTATHKIVAMNSMGFKQYYPFDGWVESDAEEIYKAQIYTLNKVIKESGISLDDVIGVGITNQRESVVAWDRNTGKPIYNAIIWQCRRTSKMIERIPDNIKRLIKEKTGLLADAYFSASKMAWILKNVPTAKVLLKQNALCMGTIDSYLAFRLTGKFVTDTTNASRTMLFNINTLKWDDELLRYFGIPESVLPKVVASDEKIGGLIKYNNIPLCGIIGDQQASLLGQACTQKGEGKATYGTGCFVLLNSGDRTPKNVDKLLTTIAYTIRNKTYYALEGSVFSACNAINWLRDNLKIIKSPVETSDMAKSLSGNEGVYFVPAFTGLGAPYWNSDARGTICGMTLNTNKNHIVRSVLESIAYNTHAILQEMEKANVSVKKLHVDGGGSKNDFLLQHQADISRKKILRSGESEGTVLGAIYCVLISNNMLNFDDIERLYNVKHEFLPQMSLADSKKCFAGWQNAVNKC